MNRHPLHGEPPCFCQTLPDNILLFSIGPGRPEVKKAGRKQEFGRRYGILTLAGTAVPPKEGFPLSKATARRLAVLALLASAAVGCALLYHIDPRQAGIPEACPSIRWWALACPGCGATRAAYLLLHGQVGEAFAMNPLIVAALPPLAVGAGVVLVRLWQGRPLPRGPRWLYAAILVLLALYTVARNLPGSPLWPGAMIF